MSDTPRHVGFSMDELAELDAAERARIRKANIDATRSYLQRRRAAGAHCDAVERHLARLESEQHHVSTRRIGCARTRRTDAARYGSGPDRNGVPMDALVINPALKEAPGSSHSQVRPPS